LTTSAARRVAAAEKYEAYKDQESEETSTRQELDRVTGIYAEGPAWTDLTEILWWYLREGRIWSGLGFRS
jgi:hypothetical protein